MSIHLVDTDLLDVITSAAATLDVHAAFIDATNTNGTVILMDKQQTAITTATTTTIVAAPTGATEIRNVTSLFIRNKHATLATDVTVRVNGTIDVELFKVTLLAGQTLIYSEQLGFYVPPTARYDRTKRVGTLYVNATTSFTDITDLTLPVSNGKTYNFLAHLVHDNDASTTGSRFGINGPSLTNVRVTTIDTVTNSVTAAALSAGSVTAVDTAATAQTTGSTTARLAILTGQFTAGADGTFAIRGASEVAVAAGLEVHVGSWLNVWEPTG